MSSPRFQSVTKTAMVLATMAGTLSSCLVGYLGSPEAQGSTFSFARVSEEYGRAWQRSYTEPLTLSADRTGVLGGLAMVPRDMRSVILSLILLLLVVFLAMRAGEKRF